MTGQSLEQEQTTAAAVSELAALARETAYDRYIQSLLVKPQDSRRDILLISAFYGELARIPLLVREPMMGEVRLQWWHDVVTAGASPDAKSSEVDFGSPLANHVTGFLRQMPAARAAFLAAIEARRRDVSLEPLSDQAELDSYLDDVCGSLLGVIAQRLGVVHCGLVNDALEAAGRAIGLSELAVRLPRLWRRGFLPIPQTSISGAGPTPAAADDLELHLRVIQSALGRQAGAHVAAYRMLQPDLPNETALAVLPLALVEPYFHALQGARYDPNQQRGPISPLSRVVRLYWASFRLRH